MNTIDMVFALDGEMRKVGVCNSAQARILIRKQLGSWHNGKLQLSLTPAFIEAAHNNPLPPGEVPVSSHELEARLRWLGSLVQAVAVKEVSLRASRIPEIVGRPLPPLEGFRVSYGPTKLEADNVWPEDDVWYTDSEHPDDPETIQALDETDAWKLLWESPPYIGRAFPKDEVGKIVSCRPPPEEPLDWTLYGVEFEVVCHPAFHKAIWDRVTITSSAEYLGATAVLQELANKIVSEA